MWVTPHFSTGQNLSIEKSFLIDPLTANNAIYRDSLNLTSIGLLLLSFSIVSSN